MNSLDKACLSDLVYAEELASDVEEDHDWKSREFGIAPGRPTIFFGRGGSGKSWLQKAMAVAIASDVPLLGRFKFAASSALIIDNEGGGRRIARQQLDALARSAGVEFCTLGKRLGYIEKPVRAWKGRAAYAVLEELALMFDVIFVDALRDCLGPNVDENALAASEPYAMARELSMSTGAAFVFNDHASEHDEGRGSRRRKHPQGHSSKLHASQTVFRFDRDDDDAPTQIACTRCQLLPRAEWPEPISFRIQKDGDAVRLVDANVRSAPTSHVNLASASDDDVRAVVNVIRRRKDLSSVEAVARVLHRKVAPVRAALRAAEQRGLVGRKDGAYASRMEAVA